jgi:hypothetical protein
MLENFDYKQYKRNPDIIAKYIKKQDNMLITKKKLYIMFPEKFVDKEMSILGSTCYILGIFAILDEDGNYAVSLIPTRMEIQPIEIDTILVDGQQYVVLEIEENSDIVSNTTLIQEDVTYPIFNLFFIQGKIPWYLDYYDLPRIFQILEKYTGSKAGRNHITFEFLTAIIARVHGDKKTEYRMVIDTIKDMERIKPSYVGLMNIWYTFKSTINKLAGSYMKLGLVSAINYPEKEISDIEHIVRE